MSERKVLNKYYPPDFDPSKIPRGKGGRNKTFTIRLMAPCNMRCTTCGEYIYKGRKFNARKEDVDDMNHLGLRIYRFYIKCTACLSEISFRTDLENTDYVLEAGATRNFEALSKAEKIAEEEARAYKEELATNPMKLLEERTEASRLEMQKMEDLEELRELNKRQAKVPFEEMITKYDKLRQLDEKKVQDEDEEFIKTVFGRDGGEKVKRIIGDDESDEDDKPLVKIPKTEKATDILSSGPSTSVAAKRKGLGIVVKKKTSNGTAAETTVKENVKDSKADSQTIVPASKGIGALGMLGDYSDSENSGDSS